MIKLFETDSYLRENITAVTACEPAGEAFRLALSASVFFPEEGGQYADTGTMTPLNPDGTPAGEPVRLLDGEKHGEEITYLAEREIPAGTAVSCRLDWEKRYSRMQQHTGEHILTGVIHNHFGYNNVGFHLADDMPVTLDLSGPLTPEQLEEMEAEANRVVYANLPVTALFPAREELASLNYRSKIEIEGQVRLIAVGDGEERVDLCACCAPHVRRTGEVGIIKIITAQNYKGGVRLGILCGSRALAHYQREWNRLDALARFLSTSVEQVPDSVAALRRDLAEARLALGAKTEALICRELEDIPAGAPAVIFTEEELPPVVVKNCYNAMTARFPGYVGIFRGTDSAGYRFAAGSASLDAGALAKGLRETFGAKGGGSREMIQGQISASREAIENYWKSLE